MKERKMSDYTTIGFFDNSFDSGLAIIKGMLEEAGIKFYVKNENMRSIQPMSNNMDFGIAVELCVETNRLKESKEIYQSIKKAEDGKGPSFKELSRKADRTMIIVAILISLIIAIMLMFSSSPI